MPAQLPMFDVAIVGAGVVGTAVAKVLSASSLDVLVLEARGDVGDATSKANTAILHTGFDTIPGSLESRLVTSGYHRLLAHAEASGIAVERTGAVLVAWDERQLAALPGLLAKAQANGYERAALIDADEVRRREPHLGPGVLGGLEVPDEFIIDPWSVNLSYALAAVRDGAVVRCGARVVGVADEGDEHLLTLADGDHIRCRWLINVAGLGADVLDRQLGHETFTVTPRRGQLLVFDKLARPLVNEILLPVPDERTKGVLVSPTVFGNVLLGPTAEDLEDRGDTASTTEGIEGLLAAGRRILPALLDEEVTAVYAGLRAATEHRDFQVALHADQRYVTVGGIRSTGLTASLALAEHVADLLVAAGVDLGPRREGDPVAMPPLGEAQVRPSQDPDRVAQDPAYGTIVCHCERVSLGEIRDAMRSDLPPEDVAGLRRRTRATNGRCQGFYCGAAVAQLLGDPGETVPPVGSGTP